MKMIVLLFVTCALLLCFASAKKEEIKPSNPTPAAQPSPSATVTIPKDGNYNAKGKVTKINLKGGSVELDHGEIVGVMPAMLMEFFVKDPSQLKALKVGDMVDFVLEYKHPTEIIVSIKKAQ